MLKKTFNNTKNDVLHIGLQKRCVYTCEVWKVSHEMLIMTMSLSSLRTCLNFPKSLSVFAWENSWKAVSWWQFTGLASPQTSSPSFCYSAAKPILEWSPALRCPNGMLSHSSVLYSHTAVCLHFQFCNDLFSVWFPPTLFRLRVGTMSILITTVYPVCSFMPGTQ